MIKIIILAFFFLFTLSKYSLLHGVEIDVTEGKIEPLPIAVVKFNYENSKEENYSSKIKSMISELVLDGKD